MALRKNKDKETHELRVRVEELRVKHRALTHQIKDTTKEIEDLNQDLFVGSKTTWHKWPTHLARKFMKAPRLPAVKDPDVPYESHTVIEPEDNEIGNLITSLLEGEKIHDPNAWHMPAIDIDFPVTVVPSQTPGHSHLYIGRPLLWSDYLKLLGTLQEIGLVEEGYYYASSSRGYSSLRMPTELDAASLLDSLEQRGADSNIVLEAVVRKTIGENDANEFEQGEAKRINEEDGRNVYDDGYW